MSMQLKGLMLVTAALCLVGCGSGSTTDPQVQDPNQGGIEPEPPTPIVIDDISCAVSYPLTLSTVNLDNDSTHLTNLYDSVKLNSSNWVGSTATSTLIVELAAPALLKEMVITWENLELSHLYDIYGSKDKESWQLLNSVKSSTASAIIPDVIALAESDDVATTALYLKVELAGDSAAQPSELLEIEVFGCEQDVSHDIELIDWYLSVPTDEDNNGKSDSIKEDDLADGYFDARFFSLTKDGGLRFSTSVSGYRTSTNTKYVRSELREMLRRGNSSYKTQGVNENNWVFSSAPQSDLDNAGGIDGELSVEVAVNSVTSTGERYQIGRVIIGQIHANDDEPVRLYYRKLPNNSKGSIYIAHEILDGDDLYYELIGSRSDSASDPVDGISLNEKFNYAINVVGNQLTVTVKKEDGTEFTEVVDMSQSGYDQGGQYMYFKAGVYNQNNSGDPHDYVQATFYKIDNSHSGYAH